MIPLFLGFLIISFIFLSQAYLELSLAFFALALNTHTAALWITPVFMIYVFIHTLRVAVGDGEMTLDFATMNGVMNKLSTQMIFIALIFVISWLPLLY